MVVAFVRNGCHEEIDIVRRKIERTADNQLVTKMVKKKYRLVFDKRRVLENSFDTIPFGFK